MSKQVKKKTAVRKPKFNFDFSPPIEPSASPDFETLTRRMMHFDPADRRSKMYFGASEIAPNRIRPLHQHQPFKFDFLESSPLHFSPPPPEPYIYVPQEVVLPPFVSNFIAREKPS